MKRITVDARMVGPVGHGIARYVQLMARGLREIRRDYEIVFLTHGKSRGPEFADFAGFECVDVKIPFLHPAEALRLPAELKRLGADLHHSPSFSSLVRSPCPWIVTVHDLIHLTYGGRARKLYYEYLLKPFVRKAAAVTTVSEYSRGLIHRWAGVDSEVVFNAIEEEHPADSGTADSAILGEHSLRRGKYFLCLSNAKPHKNLPMLLRAYSRYREDNPEAWSLAMTASFSESIRQKPGIISLDALSPAHANALLRNAGALAYPSLLEGFGRPPLEAAVQGVPVLVSRIPPHVEAMIDFKPGEALWADPWDENAWVAALKKAQNGEVKAASDETRKAVLERYSVAEMGRHMDRIYRRVLGLRP